MGCDFPLKGYRSRSEKTSAGKPAITFNPLKAINSTSPFEVPCGNCIGCKLEYSRQWAVRMVHESKLHPCNSFLTLTYADESLPSSYGLDVRHAQLFLKRLRKSLDVKIRFYLCGEYGDQTGRPHYHAIVFNYDPPDKQPYKIINQKLHYISSSLTDVWQLGHATVADVTPQSCAYVARYVTKKIKSGDQAGADRYYRQSPVDLNFYNVKPEFSLMSRKPGLGTGYVEQFKSDFYPSGFIIVDGVKQAPPRFYINKLTEEEQTKLKRAARRKSLVFKEHTTTERRRVRAAVRDARITKLKRTL